MPAKTFPTVFFSVSLTMKLGEGKDHVNLAPHWGSVFYLITLARLYWTDADGHYMDWARGMMDKDYGESVADFINKFGDRITIYDNEEEYNAASGKSNLIENTP